MQPSKAQIAPLPYTAVPSAGTGSPSAKSTESLQDSIAQATITGWSLDSEVAPWTLSSGEDVALAAGDMGFVVFFNSVGREPAQTEFRYRLDDYDPTWTITRSHVAHFRRLSAGLYHFEVQARIPGQPWQTPMAVLAVHQQPFFYQTWYFYLVLSIGAIALAAQLLRQRDQLMKGQMGIILEERNRIAGDCHDTLMAGLAAIGWQLEATSKLFPSDENACPAARSCELARSMVAHCQAEARRIIWDLRDSEELTNVLSHAMSRAVSTHPLRGNIDIAFDVQGNELPVAPGAVHHLVCIAQEAITNAIRHSGCSRIEVALRYATDALRLRISDDGRGFNPSDSAIRTGHFGIPVMEQRARKLGGALQLTTSIDSGTAVAVTVSFDLINRPTNEQHFVIPWIGV